MKVKDFICFCAKLGNLELPDRYVNDDEGREALQDDRVKNLLICLNCVLQEVYSDFGEVCQKTVAARDGKIDLSELNLGRVLRLTRGDNAVAYRFSADGLFAELDGEFCLTYRCSSPKVTWESQFPVPVQLSETAIAFGTLCNYFLSVGDLSSSQAWQERYRQALFAALKKGSTMTLPVGRWLR